MGKLQRQELAEVPQLLDEVRDACTVYVGGSNYHAERTVSRIGIRPNTRQYRSEKVRATNVEEDELRTTLYMLFGDTALSQTVLETYIGFRLRQEDDKDPTVSLEMHGKSQKSNDWSSVEAELDIENLSEVQVEAVKALLAVVSLKQPNPVYVRKSRPVRGLPPHLGPVKRYDGNPSYRSKAA